MTSTFRAKEERLHFFREQDFPDAEVQTGMATIRVSEDDPRVVEVHKELLKWRVPIRFDTEFTAEELRNAKYLRAYTNVPRGYPQPDDGAYFSVTYQAGSYCEECRLGGRQINPFRAKRVPRLNERTIFSMYWLESKLFMNRGFFESVFTPFGAACIPVILHGTDKVIESIVQLDTRDVPKLKLDIDEEPYEVCGMCQRKKYIGPRMGPDYPFLEEAKTPIVQSEQNFGMGWSSAPKVYFSQELYQTVCAAGARGLKCIPVASCREGLIGCPPWI